jgi:hypothetical protein
MGTARVRQGHCVSIQSPPIEQPRLCPPHVADDVFKNTCSHLWTKLLLQLLVLWGSAAMGFCRYGVVLGRSAAAVS